MKWGANVGKSCTYDLNIKGASGLCVRFFFLNVDGQGTQAIIKNLNLKKSKRFWNQNFIEVNDYTVILTIFFLFCWFFK